MDANRVDENGSESTFGFSGLLDLSAICSSISSKNKEDVMLLYNFYYDTEKFAVPKLPGKKKWYFVTKKTSLT